MDTPPPAPHDTAPAHATLRKNYLSGFENVAQTLGTMAPTGTLGVVLPLIIGKSGNATWLLFLVVLGICLLILVNINVFAKKSASSGGIATFAALGLGRSAGIANGWIYFGAMMFAAASSAPSGAYYACLLITQFTGIANTVALQALVTTAIVAAAGWTAFRDIKLSSDVMIVIEVTSLAVMIAIIAVAMHSGGTWVDRPQLTLQGSTPGLFTSGLVLAFLTLGGFESATTLGEEAKDAETTIPNAIMRCVVPLGVLYLVMTYLLVGLGRKYGIALDQLEAPFDTIARANHMGLLGAASSAGVAMSYFACTLGSINAGSRTLYSMAERGLFPAPFAVAHRRNATPDKAIWVISVLAILAPVGVLVSGISLVSCIDYLSQLAALGFIGAYFMVCLAAPYYLRKSGQLGAAGVLFSVAALLLLTGVLLLSVYPVPSAPACYLPYVFAALTAGGCAYSLTLQTRAAALGTP